jgi:hypothetical protein
MPTFTGWKHQWKMMMTMMTTFTLKTYCTIPVVEVKEPKNMTHILIVKLTMKSGFGPRDKS